MARKSFGHYQQFLRSVATYWTQLGANFSVGDWNFAEVEREIADFKQLQDQIAKVEADLNHLRYQRGAKCKRIENFNSRLRGGVLGSFGATSGQLLNLPRLMKAGPGRPSKASETRRANTLKRKAALEAEKVAKWVAENSSAAPEMESL